MDTAHRISVSALRSLLGSPAGPLIVDVRHRTAFDADERMLPGALRCDPGGLAALPSNLQSLLAAHSMTVVYCAHGNEVGREAAALLRKQGYPARYLENGIEGWADAGAPTMLKRADLGIPFALPSKWVTRERPKIDRIACPWLIRRFIDPQAQFAYVPAPDVLAAARQLCAIPYDVPGVEFSHVGDACSFDAVLRRFGLAESSLDALAAIVRGADTGKPDLTPQSAGLLAISLGLSLNFSDDHEMLEHGMRVYDALYAWLRGARGEIHNADLFSKPAP